MEAESTAVEQLQNGLVRCAGDKCEGDEAFRQIFLIARYNVKIGEWMEMMQATLLKTMLTCF